jgi:hypothetical protein
MSGVRDHRCGRCGRVPLHLAASGRIHAMLGNRAKSESNEQTPTPYSRANAARCASGTRPADGAVRAAIGSTHLDRAVTKVRRSRLPRAPASGRATISVVGNLPRPVMGALTWRGAAFPPRGYCAQGGRRALLGPPQSVCDIVVRSWSGSAVSSNARAPLIAVGIARRWGFRIPPTSPAVLPPVR